MDVERNDRLFCSNYVEGIVGDGVEVEHGREHSANARPCYYQGTVHDARMRA